MKNFIAIYGQIICLAIMVLLVAVPAHAVESSACYVIGNSDARNYCLAKARQESSQCYAIQSPAVRAQCLAEVRR